MKARLAHAFACLGFLGTSIILSGIVLPGCGVSSASSPTPRVWGHVGYNGNSLTDGAILFMPVDRSRSNWGAGVIDQKGRYSISMMEASNGLEPGKYEVFFKFGTRIHKLPDPRHTRFEEAESSRSGEDWTVRVLPPIPDRFTNPRTSGLVIQIGKESSRIDFDLKG